MLTRSSRYAKTLSFRLEDQDADATSSADSSDSTLFPGLRPRDIGAAIGMVEHVLSAGDRLDHLARHYYNDDRLWWRILDANPQLIYGGDLFPVTKSPVNPDAENDSFEMTIEPSLVGTIILIPQAREE